MTDQEPYAPSTTSPTTSAAGGNTGWWDDHGRPAPWPDDFFDPDSGWQPTTGGDTTNTSTQPLLIHY